MPGDSKINCLHLWLRHQTKCWPFALELSTGSLPGWATSMESQSWQLEAVGNTIKKGRFPVLNHEPGGGQPTENRASVSEQNITRIQHEQKCPHTDLVQTTCSHACMIMGVFKLTVPEQFLPSQGSPASVSKTALHIYTPKPMPGEWKGASSPGRGNHLPRQKPWSSHWGTAQKTPGPVPIRYPLEKLGKYMKEKVHGNVSETRRTSPLWEAKLQCVNSDSTGMKRVAIPMANILS